MHKSYQILTIFVLINTIKCAVIMSGTIITSNGVKVFTDGVGNLHCDTIICPKNTACIYQSSNNPVNVNKIITVRQCVNDKNRPVSQLVTEKDAAPGEFVNIYVTTKTDPEMSKNISKHVQNEIQKSMNELSQVFTPDFPFKNGNPFNNNFPFKGCNPFGPGFPFNNPCENE